ncbi:ATP-binding cassette domain-containing protein [Sphingomonas sp.]|jgi:ABC-type multidrug transport system ATPase subunit|uniref:ATP-binding cassette domain-containing protein n=1 Tax=Sphingomonas sp. TaxID=28214 RepID=UPI00356ADF9E
MNPIVRLESVSVERSGQRVVHEVDLTVGRGSWFGLIGANGSGKTSLLRALAGRLPFAGGSCRIDGDELILDRAARATRVGFSPPPDKLPDALRVREALELIGGGIDEILPRLGPLRAALALDALLNRWIGDCSAGMRQRIAIALAFVDAPALVILDEPFNWLDPVASFDLRQALRAMVDNGLTLMTALHDLGTLAAACDTGLMLADGRVAMALDDNLLRTAAQNPQAFERQMIDLLRSNGDEVNGRFGLGTGVSAL